MEVFQEVAAGMATRGHNQTAKECRSKAKDMRLKFKKTVTGSDDQQATEDSSGDGEGSEDGATGAGPAHPHETEDEEGKAEEEEEEEEEEREEEPVEAAQRDPGRLPPDVNMEDLTPGERAALITARRRRVSALQRVADNLADQSAEESRAAERAEQRRHQKVLEEMRAGRAHDGEDREDRQAMRRAMETSSAAIVDLTCAVTQLVDTIRLQGHQPPQVGPMPQPAQDIQSGTTPGSREAPAGNTVHDPLGIGAPVAKAGSQGGTATGACAGGPEHQGAVPAGIGAATPKHGRPSAAPTPGGGCPRPGEERKEQSPRRGVCWAHTRTRRQQRAGGTGGHGAEDASSETQEDAVVGNLLAGARVPPKRFHGAANRTQGLPPLRDADTMAVAVGAAPRVAWWRGTVQTTGTIG
ncbi:UNVERIFIED_CONTAM: hypothetical protein K2H54_056893 [Gekko kuhli]